MSASLFAATEPQPAAATVDRTPRRLGVLGGTFDPPHVGHLWLGAMAADALGLERVLFVPAAQPPHKRGQVVTRASDRMLMTRLAIATDPNFELCGIELERPGPSYTIDTIDELEQLYGAEAKLHLVMAADSLNSIDSWREPDRLLERIEWVVGPRPGNPLPDRSALVGRFGAHAARIHLLDGPSLDVSSTDIRRRVAAGHTIRYLVPRGVEELIVERGLYRRG